MSNEAEFCKITLNITHKKTNVMLQRLLKSLTSPIAEPSIESLYRQCVATARQPVFYRDWQVPDTLDGRFDLLILHVILVIFRLKDYSQETQQLFDILFADMDKNLRQIGVSDIRIAKKMKPLLAAFYGRAKIYEQALAGEDSALSQALARNIYGGAAFSPESLNTLTAYVRQARQMLATENTEVLLAGKIGFPKI